MLWQEPQSWALTPWGDDGLPPHRVSDDGRRLSWRWSDVEPTPQKRGYLDLNFFPGWREVVVNGRDPDFGNPGECFLVYPDGATMAPVRRLARLLGLQCDWRDNQVVLSGGEGHTFTCRLGSAEATVDGKPVVLARPAVSRPVPWAGAPVLVAPLRAICDAFGVQCALEYSHSRVVITGDKIPPPPDDADAKG